MEDTTEALCVRYICKKYKTDGLESFGYGKGYGDRCERQQFMMGGYDEKINRKSDGGAYRCQ